MQSVLDYLKLHQARFVAELCDYLRFASVSAQPQHKPDLQACAEWLAKHCRAIGLEVKISETAGHPIVVAKTPREKNSRKPHFMIYGHYDVQPPEPLELWK
ncbi:MAG TPA: peptidase M20, partial [Verrucomicrobiae bacterium]|nr:peptidase M20 [Verrucomicrobiae bacterium]